MTKWKFCLKCEDKKLVTQFGNHAASKDGLKTSCRSCVAAYNKRYKIANVGRYYGVIK